MIDLLARAACQATRPDTSELLALAVRSPALKRAIDRSLPVRASEDLAETVRSKVLAQVAKAIVEPGGFDPARVADGASFEGWLDRFARTAVRNEVSAYRRSTRPVTLVDPADLDGLPDATGGTAARAREDLLDRIVAGLTAHGSALRGSHRHLHLAAALSQGLGLKPLLRPSFSDPLQRAQFLEWVATDEAMAQVRRAWSDAVSSQPKLCSIGQAKVAETMVSGHRISELRSLLDQQDVVLRQLLTAAAVARPVPKKSLTETLGDRLAAQNPQVPALHLRRLVRAWSAATAELAVSQWRDPDAAEKDEQQRREDRERFVQQANIAAAETVTFAGMSPGAIRARLDAMFSELEMAALEVSA